MGRLRDAARRALEVGAPVRAKQRKHGAGRRSRQGPGVAAAWSPAAGRRLGGGDEVLVERSSCAGWRGNKRVDRGEEGAGPVLKTRGVVGSAAWNGWIGSGNPEEEVGGGRE